MMRASILAAALAAAVVVAIAQTPSPQDRIQIFERKIGAGGVVMAGTPGDNIQFIATEFGFEEKQVKGAPYSADAVTETTQVLPDGNKISHKNTAQLYRDGEGRTRRDQEMGHIGPWAAKAGFKSSIVHDPVADLHFILEPGTKTARKLPSLQNKLRSAGGMTFSTATTMALPRMAAPGVPAEAGVRVAAPPEGLQIVSNVEHFEAAIPQSGAANFNNESLGTKVIEGVVAEGTKTTITIPAGQIGNERPIEVVSERWYSPELQTVVMTRRSDPRMGERTYKLTNIRRNEPGKYLFEIPADYTVQESNTRAPHVEVFREGPPPQE
jgi:hypothetical protein